MPLDHPQLGPNDVPTYQMSAVPFVTSSLGGLVPNSSAASPLRIRLPSVSRFVVVHNTGDAPVRVGFTVNGVSARGSFDGSGDSRAKDRNYFILSGNQTTGRLELRCKDLYFMTDVSNKTSDVSVLAGVTPISVTKFPVLTGSSGYEGIG